MALPYRERSERNRSRNPLNVPLMNGVVGLDSIMRLGDEKSVPADCRCGFHETTRHDSAPLVARASSQDGRSQSCLSHTSA